MSLCCILSIVTHDMTAKNGLIKVKYKLWITFYFLVDLLGSRNLNIEVKVSLSSAEFICCLCPNIDNETIHAGLLLCFVDAVSMGSGYSP